MKPSIQSWPWETKAGAVLQLCLYSDLIKEVQGLAPEHMFVVVPWSDFEPQQYRFADYAAYFRRVKRELLRSLSERGGLEKLSRSERALHNMRLAGGVRTAAPG